MASRLRRLRNWQWACIIILVALFSYIGHVSLIHWSNARHARAWDQIEKTADQLGIPTRPIDDPPGLTRFYDESTSFRGRHGLTYSYAGFVDDNGTVVIPPVLKLPRKNFSEGLVFAGHRNGQRGYFRPDGSLAFAAEFDYAKPFVNGMAHVRNEVPSVGPPAYRSGYIDIFGTLVIPYQYHSGSHFIGDYAIVSKGTIYAPIYNRLMDGIDVDLGLGLLFPPGKGILIDREGRRVTPSAAKNAFSRLD